MDMLRSSAAAACFLGVIFSMLSNIVPSDKFNKQINIIFALILILAVIPPFMDAEFDLSANVISEEGIYDYSEIYNAQLNRQTQSNITEEMRKIFEQNGINTVKISVDVNNSADGSISITKAEIVIADREKLSEARKIASAALGRETDITVTAYGSEKKNEY